MSKAYEIHSKQPAEILLSRLKSQTEILRSFRYLRWVDLKTNNFFYGTFQDYLFKLVVRVSGRNFLTPVIEGEVLQEGEGSALRYTVKMSPDVKKMYVIALLFLFVFLTTSLGRAINPPGIERGSILFKYLALFSIGAITAIFTGLNRHIMKKYEKATFEKFSSLAEQED